MYWFVKNIQTGKLTIPFLPLMETGFTIIPNVLLINVMAP